MIRKKLIAAALIIMSISVGIILILYLFPKDPDRNYLQDPPHGWSYIRGYCAGMGWAKADLEERKAFILTAGLPAAALDQETGLRIQGLDCVIDAGRKGIVEGYNRTVRHWIHQKGVPEYSRKRWESVLFHLTEYFDRRAQTDPPEEFMVNGPPILSSNNLTKVFLKSQQSDKYLLIWEAGVKNPFWSPFSNIGPIEFSTWPMLAKQGLLLYYPGPPGSDLLLLRGQAGRTTGEMTGAFDMRYGSWIRYEPSSF